VYKRRTKTTGIGANPNVHSPGSRMRIEDLGTQCQPFHVRGQPRVFVQSKSQKAGTAFLHAVLNHKRGVGVLYGRAASGKTTLVHNFIQSLPADSRAAVVDGSAAGPSEFLAAMLTQIGYQGTIDLADSEAANL